MSLAHVMLLQTKHPGLCYCSSRELNELFLFLCDFFFFVSSARSAHFSFDISRRRPFASEVVNEKQLKLLLCSSFKEMIITKEEVFLARTQLAAASRKMTQDDRNIFRSRRNL